MTIAKLRTKRVLISSSVSSGYSMITRDRANACRAVEVILTTEYSYITRATSIQGRMRTKLNR